MWIQSQQYVVIGGGGNLIISNAGMNTTGGIVISDGINFMTFDFGEAHLRRLTLGSDGNLRVYSWSQNSSKWTIIWREIQQQCKIYGMCGPKALCVDKLDDTHTCICPLGFYTKSSTDTSLSLDFEPNIVLMNCTSTQVQNPTSYKFISLEFVNFQGHDLLPLSSVTLNQCEAACRNNYSCVGFYYKYSHVLWKAMGSQNCFLKAKLLNGYQSPDADRMFIKVSALEFAQSAINSSNSMMRPEYSAAFSFSFASLFAEELNTITSLTSSSDIQQSPFLSHMSKKICSLESKFWSAISCQN
jgi:hypothetical protein